jgi:hypothetical protein
MSRKDVKVNFAFAWSDGYRADSGPSRDNPCRPALRRSFGSVNGNYPPDASGRARPFVTDVDLWNAMPHGRAWGALRSRADSGFVMIPTIRGASSNE